MILDEDKIQSIFSTAREDIVEEFVCTFNKYSDIFLIDTELQKNLFLAQIREEVGVSLESRRENLNYSTSALKKIFKYYKKHPSESRTDGRNKNHRANQRKIANKAYANRIGNGDYSSGDGYRFRGGGMIQLTGRGNYQKIAKILTKILRTNISSLDVETEISTVRMGTLASMAFWYKNKIYKCKNIDCCTAIVNKHTKSYKERKKHYEYIISL